MRTLLLSILLIITFNLTAQPDLVADFNPGNENGFVSWFQNYHIKMGDNIILQLNNGTTGFELGILKDNQLSILKDIVPGEDSSDPENFTLVDNEIFFTVEIDSDLQLWKTDGTTDGTTIVHTFESVFELGGMVQLGNGKLIIGLNQDLFVYENETMTNISTEHGLSHSWEHSTNAFVNFNDGLVFCSDYGNGKGVFFTDGTTIDMLGIVEVSSPFAEVYGMTLTEGGINFGVTAKGYFHLNTDNNTISPILFNGGTQDASRLLEVDDMSDIVYISGEGYFFLQGDTYSNALNATSPQFLVQGVPIYSSSNDGKIVFESSSDFTSSQIYYAESAGQINQALFNTGEKKLSSIFNDGDKVYFASGVFNPEFWSVDLATKTYELIYAYPSFSVSGDAKLIGTQGNSLYFVSGLDSDVGNELYKLPLSDEPSAIRDIEFEGDIILTPDGFEIRRDDDQKVVAHIHDPSGRLVRKLKTRTNERISNIGLSGIYYITFKVDGSRASKGHYFHE